MTDLDALIENIRLCATEYQHATDGTLGKQVATRLLLADCEALRARLAPTTHADDEALLVGVAEAVRDMDDEGYNAAMDRVARRLAELRARAEKAEVRAHELTVAFDQQDMALDGARGCLDEQTTRAETAERALAECREAVAELRAEVRKTVPLVMDALKKEPRDA